MKSGDLHVGMLFKSIGEHTYSYDCIIEVTKVKIYSFDFKIVKLGNKSSLVSKGEQFTTSLDNLDYGNYIPVDKKIKRLK